MHIILGGTKSYAGMTKLAVDMEAANLGKIRRGKLGLREYFFFPKAN